MKGMDPFLRNTFELFLPLVRKPDKENDIVLSPYNFTQYHHGDYKYNVNYRKLCYSIVVVAFL